MRARLIQLVLVLTGVLPGASFAQPSGLPMAGFVGGGVGLTPFYVLGFELGPWQDYLARELTPTYLLDSGDEPVHVSWLDGDMVMILPLFAEDLMAAPDTRMQVSFDWQRATSLVLPGMDPMAVAPLFNFERQMFEPGLLHQLTEHDVLGVSAVLAYQRFGASGLGMQAIESGHVSAWGNPWYDPLQDSGYGAGVRLALHSELTPRIAFDVDYQSRIDMEEFGNYYGVYSQPADLDIPARASVGLALQAGTQSWLSVSIERVLYSDISAFASRTLPDRFLSLLGDSTSPDFGWDDLTVYTVGWRWSDGETSQWRLDFSSRAQPNPTSRTLSQALSGELAENAMTVGYTRRTGDQSRFDLNAAYAPAEYAFGGSVLGVASESLDQDFELEALWILDF